LNVAAACALSRRLETDIRSRPDDKIAQGQNGGEQRNGQVDHDRVHTKILLQFEQAWRVNGLREWAQESGRCDARQDRRIPRCDQDALLRARLRAAAAILAVWSFRD